MKLWIDDCRVPPVGWVWAKDGTTAEALLSTGKVEEVSFDHDLGEGITGYDVASFIESLVWNGSIKCPKWNVHSANPVGAARIKAAMRSAEAGPRRHLVITSQEHDKNV